MMEPTEDQRFAEEMGQTFDRWSLPRMAGRVWGILLVSEEPALSSQDLADRLHASAGSISTATRYLLDHRLIERVRRPGERKEFFRFDPTSTYAMFQQRIDAVAGMHRIFEIAEPRFEDRPVATARLAQMHDFYEWMELQLRALMREWRSQHTERADHPGG